MMESKVRELLYDCIKELEYVQSVENCHSGLCASSLGAELIERGMKLLDIKDLSTEKLLEQALAGEGERLSNLIASLRERADILDGGKVIKTCGIVPLERAKAFRQVAAELSEIASPTREQHEVSTATGNVVFDNPMRTTQPSAPPAWSTPPMGIAYDDGPAPPAATDQERAYRYWANIVPQLQFVGPDGKLLTVERFADELTAAYERGRLAGLDEAAKEVETLNKWWPATCSDQPFHDAAKAIRAAATQRKGESDGK